MNTKIVLILFLTLTGVTSLAAATLPEYQRAFLAESVYHGCEKVAVANAAQKPLPKAEAEKRADAIPRFCNCAATYLTEHLGPETIKTIESSQEFNPAAINQILQSFEAPMQSAAEWCKENLRQYNPVSPNYGVHQNKDNNGSVLFNGQAHRFTAFIQEIYDTNLQLIETNRVELGIQLLDLTIDIDRISAHIYNPKNEENFLAKPLTEPSQKARKFGYNFAYFIPENDGTLLLNSARNVLALLQYNLQENRLYQTYFIKINTLLCSALAEAKTRAIAGAAKNLFKEILLVTLKSYAGTSYSRGNFTGYTSTGQFVSGVYTSYDNSWLGEHYSRSIDTIFMGAATVSQIDAEEVKNQCHNRQIEVEF